MKALTEADLLGRLSVKFGPPEWAFLPQMADGTGKHKRRIIDAVAMNLWPSRGLELHGFEIKVQRPDFLRELKDPKKADDAIHYCDRWWIVAANKDIAKEGELPPTWGLMVPHGAGLKMAVVAPFLHKKRIEKFDRTFIAGMLRKASGRYSTFAQRSAIRSEIWEGVEKEFLKEHRLEMENVEKIKAAMEEFQETSGISIYQFTESGKAQAVGTIVKAVLGNYGGLLWKLESARDTAHGAYEELAKIAKELIGSIRSEQEEIFESEEKGDKDG